MTNLFLTITLGTNICVSRIDVSNTIPNHLYSMQTASTLTPVPGVTNWQKGWVFDSTMTSWYDYTDTNKFYRVEDLGVKF